MAALVFRVACKFLLFKVDWTYGASGSVCPGRLLGFNWPVRKRVRLGTESFLKTENLIGGVHVNSPSASVGPSAFAESPRAAEA